MNLAEKLKNLRESNRDLGDLTVNSRVLLVDGLNNFIRNFAANPTMDDNGEPVGGFIGFMKSIGLAIRQFRPTRVIIVFDGKGGSLKRRAIFSEYKAHRKTNTRLNRTYEYDTIEEEKDNQKKQLLQLVHFLAFLPVTVIAIDNVEADDVIGYIATMVEEKDGTALIMSSDKDFLQLVSDKVKVYSPVKKKMYDPEGLVEEYGVHPNNFMIFRTIDGDDGDNIDGIKGIGLKTLLKNFPELANKTMIPWDHIYTQCQEKIDIATQLKKKNRACQLILDNKAIVERNMTLMRLDEQHLGASARDKILTHYFANINQLNKVGLTQFLVRSRLSNSFGDLSEWVTNTFAALTRFSTKG